MKVLKQIKFIIKRNEIRIMNPTRNINLGGQRAPEAMLQRAHEEYFGERLRTPQRTVVDYRNGAITRFKLEARQLSKEAAMNLRNTLAIILFNEGNLVKKIN